MWVRAIDTVTGYVNITNALSVFVRNKGVTVMANKSVDELCRFTTQAEADASLHNLFACWRSHKAALYLYPDGVKWYPAGTEPDTEGDA